MLPGALNAVENPSSLCDPPTPRLPDRGCLHFNRNSLSGWQQVRPSPPIGILGKGHGALEVRVRRQDHIPHDSLANAKVKWGIRYQKYTFMLLELVKPSSGRIGLKAKVVVVVVVVVKGGRGGGGGKMIANL